MINFRKLFETVYEPRAGDEKNFKDKHVIAKHKHPVALETQFTSDKSKAKRKADYDKSEDEAVYEAAELHTKRADKEPVVVRKVDPKTGQSKAKTVMRGAGEIKIGEEVELDEGVSNLSDARLKFHVLKNVPHGSYSNKELAAEHDRRKKTGGAEYSSVKPSLNEKVDNAYAIGMSAAMKKAGDTAPLKKSTIVKGHEIAKSIMKKEAMDPVGKHDADIDNDGDTDKSDKYLIARRKAIGKAIRKEEVEQIDELSPNTLHSYTKKAALSLAGNASGVGAAVGAGKKPHKDLTRYTTNRVKGITAASGRLADKANSDMHESMAKEEVEQIDELSKKTLGSYIKKAKTDVAGEDFKKRQSVAGLKKMIDDHDNRAKTTTSPLKKDHHRKMSQQLRDQLADMKEEVDLDEAFKAGAMKLHDGSAVTLTRESVDALNMLFNQLNGANKSKMEERMMSGKKGFQEILSFAENI
jgi:hypothetical protein